jgi:hypothetical protein
MSEKWEDQEGTEDIEVVEETNVDPFHEMAQAFAKPTTGPSGAYLKDLTADERQAVEDFSVWLKANTTMTDASRASYRSYLAACMVAFRAGKSRQDLTSSQRSAAKKFGEYLASR